jgi:hypothetical protein
VHKDSKYVTKLDCCQLGTSINYGVDINNNEAHHITKFNGQVIYQEDIRRIADIRRHL